LVPVVALRGGQSQRERRTQLAPGGGIGHLIDAQPGGETQPAGFAAIPPHGVLNKPEAAGGSVKRFGQGRGHAVDHRPP
ncbi:hypothetical protein DKX15_21745, partial [Enterococcus faecium]